MPIKKKSASLAAMAADGNVDNFFFIGKKEKPSALIVVPREYARTTGNNLEALTVNMKIAEPFELNGSAHCTCIIPYITG